MEGKGTCGEDLVHMYIPPFVRLTTLEAARLSGTS